jgi:hypothetical protein
MHGARIDDFRNTDGELDRETVAGVVADTLKSRPGLRAEATGVIGIGAGNKASAVPREPVGLSALFPRKGRAA